MTSLGRISRFASALAGVVAVAYGFTLPATGSQDRWIACLALGGMLVSLGLWPRKPAGDLARSPAVNVVAVMVLIFGMLAVQMGRVQVLSGRSIAEQSGADPFSGDVLSNPREVERHRLVDRGTIYDRNGIVLAESVLRDGVYHRVYPVPAASYVCGYFSPMKYGSTGLEASFDDMLSGDDRTFDAELDRLLGRYPEGADLRLTLDAGLQQEAHDLLGGRTGAIVVIDVHTGAVIVLASSPFFDPNRLAAVDDETAAQAGSYWEQLQSDESRPLVTRATSGLYTPGSTFKTVTAAAAIDTGEAAPNDVYRDEGQLDVDGRVIVEHNRPDDSIDEWTLAEGLAYSLNVVFAQVGLEIGPDVLTEYAERLGFGQEIPFDVPVTPGQVASSGDFLDSPVALAETAFGQGELLTTPLGMALVAAAFANGGEIMRPYLVEEAVTQEGEPVFAADQEVWRTPVERNTANTVRDMMIGAVELGYATNAAIDGLVVGGKTGTAETGTDVPHAWFIGFAGDPEPRYAVAVVLEHGGAGTQEPISIARDILAATFAALND